MESITSVNNTLIKELSALKQKKARLESGLFAAEGVRLAEEAVKSGTVQYLFVTEPVDDRTQALLNYAARQKADVYSVPPHVLERLCDTRTPQGVVAVCELPATRLSGLPPEGTLLVLDRVQDPGNLGTLLRTADAAGVSGLALLAGTTDAYAPKAVRSSMGSLFHLPVVQDVSEADLLAYCMAQQYDLVVTSLEGSTDLYQTRLQGRKALVLGSEAAGVSPTLLAAAHTRLRIPMAGQAESLNVAMSGAIILFEMLRQNRYGK